jgi:hypothetical protein
MQRFAFLLLSFSTFAFTQSKPDVYSISVHVTASRCVIDPTFIKGGILALQLNASMDGKKYELRSRGGCSLLRPGDYKAKLIADTHKNSYEVYQEYEFQFSDAKTKKFELVGMKE